MNACPANYPLSQTWQHARGRLRLLEDGHDPGTFPAARRARGRGGLALPDVGVGGPEARRAGSGPRAVRRPSTALVEPAPGLEIDHADVVTDALPGDGFDLVFTRLLFMIGDQPAGPAIARTRCPSCDVGYDVGRQASHLVTVLGDIGTQQVEQDHFGACVRDILQTTNDFFRCPADREPSSTPGIAPSMRRSRRAPAPAPRRRQTARWTRLPTGTRRGRGPLPLQYDERARFGAIVRHCPIGHPVAIRPQSSYPVVWQSSPPSSSGKSSRARPWVRAGHAGAGAQVISVVPGGAGVFHHGTVIGKGSGRRHRPRRSLRAVSGLAAAQPSFGPERKTSGKWQGPGPDTYSINARTRSHFGIAGGDQR